MCEALVRSVRELLVRYRDERGKLERTGGSPPLLLLPDSKCTPKRAIGLLEAAETRSAGMKASVTKGAQDGGVKPPLQVRLGRYEEC